MDFWVWLCGLTCLQLARSSHRTPSPTLPQKQENTDSYYIPSSSMPPTLSCRMWSWYHFLQYWPVLVVGRGGRRWDWPFWPSSAPLICSRARWSYDAWSTPLVVHSPVIHSFPFQPHARRPSWMEFPSPKIVFPVSWSWAAWSWRVYGRSVVIVETMVICDSRGTPVYRKAIISRLFLWALVSCEP